jgi:hypothetical protein
MPEHLAATLQKVCWVSSKSLMAAPNPPSTSMGADGACESEKGGKPSKSEKWTESINRRAMLD